MEYRTISLADQVFEKLENDILSGKYERGQLVTELQLCTELGVSRTPVREALRRLFQEHLIEDTPKGTMVLGISRQDFIDMYQIRQRIEGLAIRGFIREANEDALKSMKETIDFQEFYLKRNDAEHLKSLDGRFHEIIYNNCGSRILCDTLTPLHRKVQKYRRAAMSRQTRAANSVQEHWELYTAICDKDGDRAEALIMEHVQNAMEAGLREVDA
ncbi:MAG: GntR family transcriptional regulator [Clostridia bacterium]|nr:GntR family transcriptional regulator [Clostridia bacterium]